MASQDPNYISDFTQKRLIRDITDIYKRPLTDQGIFYHHDDENMLKGYAMIIGPRDSLYEDGFYFFDITYPYNYPQDPPVVKYMTNDSKTRFHPNLYTNGKVCLSILNTWKGEGWTSCQTIKSVLLTIISILDDKPLLNEPGITENYVDFESYNDIIRFKNLDFSFLEMASNHCVPSNFIMFIPFIQSHVRQCKDRILTKVQKMAVHYDEPYVITTRIYRLNIEIDWNKLYSNLVTFYKNVK